MCLYVDSPAKRIGGLVASTRADLLKTSRCPTTTSVSCCVFPGRGSILGNEVRNNLDQEQVASKSNIRLRAIFVGRYNFGPSKWDELRHS